MADPVQNSQNKEAPFWASALLSDPVHFFQGLGEEFKTTAGFIKEGDYSSLLKLFQVSGSVSPKKKWEEHFDAAVDLADQAGDFSEIEQALKKMEEEGKTELSASQIEAFKKVVMGHLYRGVLKAEKKNLTKAKDFDLNRDIVLNGGSLEIQGKNRSDIISYALQSGCSIRDVAEDLEKFKSEVKEARIKKIGLDLLHGADALMEIPGKVYDDLGEVASQASREARTGARQIEKGVRDLVGLVF